MDTISLSGIPLQTIIGIHAWEQLVPQKLIIDLILETDAATIALTDNIEHAIDYEKILKTLFTFAKSHHYQLVESFADHLAKHLLAHFHTNRVILTIHKPGALKEAKDVAITVTRSR